MQYTQESLFSINGHNKQHMQICIWLYLTLKKYQEYYYQNTFKMNNEIRINVPEGMEIDKENSTFECIKFKPIKKELPKTWEEFCKNNPIKPDEAFITSYSKIYEAINLSSDEREKDIDGNILPSKGYAEAMLALCKLIQLRDCYNDGWKPDWSKEVTKYAITYKANKAEFVNTLRYSFILSFKTEDLRDTFYHNFGDLIERAKLLL